MKDNYKRLKLACYTTNVSMSVVGNISPLLFLTFRSLYGLSYSLLGFLVFVNFFTQLLVDLLFSFFSYKFNIHKTVKFTPFLTAAGMFVYAVWPYFLPQYAYAGILIGTILFSASGGLAEVLISPLIAAIPSRDPEREMSKLHSVYAWGVVFVVIIATLFLLAFGRENWQLLMLMFMIIPIAAILLYKNTNMPEMKAPEKLSGAVSYMKNRGIWLCTFAIFLGGAAEGIMSQWSSSYLEQALGIPKVWGDICGVALFALMMAIGRSLYAKRGKNINRVLFLGAGGAFFCYLLTAVSNNPVVGLLSCAFTGFCVSMLWPGNLIVASGRFPQGGVFIYAMMAAGGDLGASVGPQITGVITDIAVKSSSVIDMAARMNLLADQLGMKIGMLGGMVFPLLLILLYCKMLSPKIRRAGRSVKV